MLQMIFEDKQTKEGFTKKMKNNLQKIAVANGDFEILKDCMKATSGSLANASHYFVDTTVLHFVEMIC